MRCCFCWRWGLKGRCKAGKITLVLCLYKELFSIGNTKILVRLYDWSQTIEITLLRKVRFDPNYVTAQSNFLLIEIMYGLTRSFTGSMVHQSALRGAGTAKPYLLLVKYKIPISLSLYHRPFYTDSYIDSYINLQISHTVWLSFQSAFHLSITTAYFEASHSPTYTTHLCVSRTACLSI